MTLYQFNELPEASRREFVHTEGTYLARRWDDMLQAVLLYQVPSAGLVSKTLTRDKNNGLLHEHFQKPLPKMG